MARNPYCDFDRVKATPEEVAAYKAKTGFTPSVYRVECNVCGQRYWCSGIGAGAHRRSARHKAAMRAPRTA